MCDRKIVERFNLQRINSSHKRLKFHIYVTNNLSKKVEQANKLIDLSQYALVRAFEQC